ncbi:MAG: hypothetical protein FWC54_06595 [Actinomycetia bacterium]|nr:hypothetical protein [Actinomycetes bacterium]
MLDTLAVVSSNPLCPLDLSRTAQDRLARVVQTFSTGEECLKALAYREQGNSCVVLVDGTLSDLSPLNLIDALRREHPGVSCVLMTDDPGPELVSRAMLAGARATLPVAATEAELAPVLRRFAHVTQTGAAGRDVGTGAGEAARQGAVVVVLSARGGAGKSTLSVLLALLAGQADLDVALVDFDAQFGDLSFLFGGIHEHSLVDLAGALAQGGQGCRCFSESVGEGVALYGAAPAPEQVDALVGQARLLLRALAREHELVIVNTGAFQALLHAELLDVADTALCVLDQTLVGVRATLRLRELCLRLGIPPARLRPVVNRAHASGGYHPTVAEVSALLGEATLRSLDDGGLKVSQSLDSGAFATLLQAGRGALAARLALILDDIALATGLDLSSLPHMRSALRRETKGRWRK